MQVVTKSRHQGRNRKPQGAKEAHTTYVQHCASSQLILNHRARQDITHILTMGKQKLSNSQEAEQVAAKGSNPGVSDVKCEHNLTEN